MTPTLPDKQRLQSVFLLVTATGLTPIALIYGIAPEKTLPWLFGIDATGVDTRHISKLSWACILHWWVLDCGFDEASAAKSSVVELVYLYGRAGAWPGS